MHARGQTKNPRRWSTVQKVRPRVLAAQRHLAAHPVPRGAGTPRDPRYRVFLSRHRGWVHCAFGRTTARSAGIRVSGRSTGYIFVHHSKNEALINARTRITGRVECVTYTKSQRQPINCAPRIHRSALFASNVGSLLQPINHAPRIHRPAYRAPNVGSL